MNASQTTFEMTAARDSVRPGCYDYTRFVNGLVFWLKKRLETQEKPNNPKERNMYTVLNQHVTTLSNEFILVDLFVSLLLSHRSSRSFLCRPHGKHALFFCPDSPQQKKIGKQRRGT